MRDLFCEGFTFIVLPVYTLWSFISCFVSIHPSIPREKEAFYCAWIPVFYVLSLFVLQFCIFIIHLHLFWCTVPHLRPPSKWSKRGLNSESVFKTRPYNIINNWLGPKTCCLCNRLVFILSGLNSKFVLNLVLSVSTNLAHVSIPSVTVQFKCL